MSATAKTAQAGWMLLLHSRRQLYALPVECVERIVAMAELSCPANMPLWLDGILNLGGQAVPVVSLSRLLDADAEEFCLFTPLVIVRDGSRRLGLRVAGVDQVIRPSADDMTPIAAGCALNDYAAAMVRSGDESAVVISVSQLLLTMERKSIEALRAIEQQRLDGLEAVAP